MSTPQQGRTPHWRDTPETEEAARRFVAIIERTLEHVTAGRLVTAKFSLSPTRALRVLAGIPTEHVRETISAVARVQTHLSENGAGVEDAKAELEKLLSFWGDGRKR